jgi:LysR family transcriptional regulator, cell division regulator
MIPQYTDLKYFLAVVETLNVSRASEHVGVVQPTISQALKRLEDIVGVPLFIRRKNGMELTRAGRSLAEESRGLMNNWRFIVDSARDSETQPMGHFKIGAHVTVAWYSAGAILPKLLHEFPKIEVSVVHGTSRELLQQLVVGKIDFGLLINPRRHPDLVIKPLCGDRYTLWYSKDCLNLDVLVVNPDTQQNEKVLSLLKDKRTFSRRIETNSYEVGARLAASGAGVAMLPERAAKPYGLSMWDRNAFVSDELCLCYRRERQRSEGARVIIEAIKSVKL